MPGGPDGVACMDWSLVVGVWFTPSPRSNVFTTLHRAGTLASGFPVAVFGPGANVIVEVLPFPIVVSR